MSGFEDPNPFSDPFGDPFQDSSITQATNTNSKVRSNLDDYNPFANQPQTKTNNVNQPAVIPTSAVNTNAPSKSLLGGGSSVSVPVTPGAGAPPPPYTSSPAQTLSQSELQRRQEELERKAAELAAREEALKNAQSNIRENNWPPLPSICPVKPCFYQDINVEIPPEFQKIVRYAYRLWMFYVVVMFVNFMGGLGILIVDGDGDIFTTSILTTVFFIPLSFLCWFRPLYKAFRTDSSINFMVFFFVFFFQCVLSVLWAIGIPSKSSCGLITAFRSHNSVVLSIFIWLVTLILIVNAIASILILLKVHNIYSHTEASLAKAQEEFRQGVFTNELTRQATSAVATSITRQAMNQAFGGGQGQGQGQGSNNPGPGLRY